jgi:hypothetical protein
MKKVNLKTQVATITTISMVAVLSAIILSQSTILPMHNAYAKGKSTDKSTDKSTENNKDCSQSDTGKIDKTNDCNTTTDNQEKEDKDNGKDKSNDA